MSSASLTTTTSSRGVATVTPTADGEFRRMCKDNTIDFRSAWTSFMNIAGENQTLRQKIKEEFSQKSKQLGFSNKVPLSLDNYKSIWELLKPLFPFQDEPQQAPKTDEIAHPNLKPVDPPRFAKRDYKNYLNYLKQKLPNSDSQNYSAADLAVLQDWFPNVEPALKTHIRELVSKQQVPTTRRGSLW